MNFLKINEKLFQIKALDERCLWMISQMVIIMKTFKRTKFKRSTIAKHTGWDVKKVDTVAKKLVDLKILEISHTIKQYGGQGANEYKITTGFISWISETNLEEKKFEIVEDDENMVTLNPEEITLSENWDTDIESQKSYPKIGDRGIPKIGEPISYSKSIPYSLNTTTTTTAATANLIEKDFLKMDLKTQIFTLKNEVVNHPLFSTIQKKYEKFLNNDELENEILLAINRFIELKRKSGLFAFVQNYLSYEKFNEKTIVKKLETEDKMFEKRANAYDSKANQFSLNTNSNNQINSNYNYNPVDHDYSDKPENKQENTVEFDNEDGYTEEIRRYWESPEGKAKAEVNKKIILAKIKKALRKNPYRIYSV